MVSPWVRQSLQTILPPRLEKAFQADLAKEENLEELYAAAKQ